MSVYTHKLVVLRIAASTPRIHKNFFYSDSTGGIPSQQKYEVPQHHASGFELQALSFLWPLYRIFILSFLPCISSSRVMTETYQLKGVHPPWKATGKGGSCELHESHHPASKVSNKINFMKNNSLASSFCFDIKTSSFPQAAFATGERHHLPASDPGCEQHPSLLGLCIWHSAASFWTQLSWPQACEKEKTASYHFLWPGENCFRISSRLLLQMRNEIEEWNLWIWEGESSLQETSWLWTNKWTDIPPHY